MPKSSPSQPSTTTSPETGSAPADHAADAAAAAHLPMTTLAELLSAAQRAAMDPAKLRMIVPSRDWTPIPGTDL